MSADDVELLQDEIGHLPSQVGFRRVEATTMTEGKVISETVSHRKVLRMTGVYLSGWTEQQELTHVGGILSEETLNAIARGATEITIRQLESDDPDVRVYEVLTDN